MTIPTKSDKAVDVLTSDAQYLKKLLENGDVTSLDLVGQYLAQIEKHDGKLHAMIQTTPKDLLEATAKSLDQERAAGSIRGPLHGIPILIKVHPILSVPKGYSDGFFRTILLLTQTSVFQLVSGALLCSVPSREKMLKSSTKYGVSLFGIGNSLTALRSLLRGLSSLERLI